MILHYLKRNPTGSNVYRKIKPNENTTPMGSNVIPEIIFYKHVNPSDCGMRLLNQLKEAVK